MAVYQDKWTVTMTASQKTEEFRLVNPNGSLGGAHGVSLRPAEEGQTIPIMLVGIATVEVASGQTIAVGDFIVGDAEGKATKAETGALGYCVANSPSAGGLVEITIK